MMLTPWILRLSDQGEAGRRSKARTWRAPLRTSSKQRAEPTKPNAPVTAKVLPSMPSLALKCILCDRNLEQLQTVSTSVIKTQRESKVLQKIERS